ncbi:MAG TPA: YraN family protein [Pirellulales bacterium]|jgi:putative endonuclease|nr:YraN family protein [Pirellulales bacterium]
MWQWLARLWPFATRTSGPLGARGEDAAARYLRGHGYRILARGKRSRMGEIDIVARDGRTLVFVEVKTRTDRAHGHPVEMVHVDKQRRLTRLALGYMKRYRLLEQPARFDIVAITWPADAPQPQIEHFKHAFEATGFDGFFS